MIVQHNIPSLNAHRNLIYNNLQTSRDLEKLSSGYRINRAADDAAGLAISEKMRAQIRGLGKAEQNAMHGINLVQTAEGALQEVHALLQRGRELVVQASNGTYQREDRAQLQLELDAITEEIDRIATYTNYNGINILDMARLFKLSMIDEIEAGTRNYYTRLGAITSQGSDTQAANILNEQAMIDAMGAWGQKAINSRADLEDYLENYWLPNALNQIMSTFDSFSDVQATVHIAFARDIDPVFSGTNPTGIAYYSYLDDSSGIGITKHVVVLDLDEFLDGKDIDPAYLDRIVAHELMHVLMSEIAPEYVTSADRSAWFLEGTAEMISGGMAHMQGMDMNDIAAAFGNEGRGVYSGGYFAATYLSWLAASGTSGYNNTATTVTADNLAYGLDLILNELRDGSTMDQIISTLTAGSAHVYADLDAFEAAIKGAGNGGAIDTDFYQNLLAATTTADGQLGAGSVIAGAGTSEGRSLSYLGRYVVGNGEATVNPGIGVEFNYDLLSGTDKIWIQAGANRRQGLYLEIDSISAKLLGVDDVNIVTDDPGEVNRYIEAYDKAIQQVSATRAKLGAAQNRLEHTLNNLSVTRENLVSAESTIRDADMARLMMSYTKNNILVQSAQAILAQATQLPQGVLTLLR